MTLRWFVYYCAAWGAVSAFVGWALGRLLAVPDPVMVQALRALFLGMVLAAVLVLVDLAFMGAKKGAAFRVLVGGFVGGLGGFVGGMVGQLLYGPTGWAAFLVFGWTLTGALIGSAPGMFEWLDRLARNEDAGGARRKVLHGILGGTLGGMLGGGCFLGLRALWGLALDHVDEFWSPTATGFAVLGACIGLLIGLAQVILKEAWVRVEAGFRAGRELILSQPVTTVGRAEGCDVALFGDPAVDKVHARIVARGGRYYVEAEGETFVNGEPVRGEAELRHGDRIGVGRAVLAFGERARRPG